MTSDPDEKQGLEAARGYLADFLRDEEFHGTESEDWFVELGEYVDQLPLEDVLIMRAAVYIRPFLDDDERIECAMYPDGDGIKFVEQGWGGDLREYLTDFLYAVGRDHARWEGIIARHGEAARWVLGQ